LSSEFHTKSLVVEAHHDLLMLVALAHSQGKTETFRDRWIPELRAGGVDVQVLPIFVSEEAPEVMLRKALEMVDALHVEVEKNTDEVMLCLTGTDIDRAIEQGKIGLILAMEGGEALGANLSMLRHFFRLGVRMISLTWNNRTLLADGTDLQDSGSRLTPLGVEVVAEMERLGIILDISHLNDPGFWHVTEIATKTFIASHSNCRAVYNHSRALTDDQLRAVAAQGGVVGMNLHPMLVHGKDATIEDCLDHLEHAIEIAGEDHVGLGPDFCAELDELGVVFDPEELSGIAGLDKSAHLPSYTDAMLARGISEDVARKVLGENFHRVLRKGLPD
jgi:membrane dipeptidase